MKKNIVIVLLTLVSVTFAVYGRIKASEAESAYLQLSETIQEAERLSEESMKFQENAFHAAADAVKQKKECERLMSELQKCQSK